MIGKRYPSILAEMPAQTLNSGIVLFIHGSTVPLREEMTPGIPLPTSPTLLLDW